MAKILVVDDEFSDLETMKTLLEAKGHEVTAVSNGANAFDSFKKNWDEFGLILLDIKMPTLSGYDLLRLLREKVNHNVPVVYVSIVPKQEVNMTDVDGFIQKPFSPESFLTVVTKSLSTRMKKVKQQRK